MQAIKWPRLHAVPATLAHAWVERRGVCCLRTGLPAGGGNNAMPRRQQQAGRPATAHAPGLATDAARTTRTCARRSHARRLLQKGHHQACQARAAHSATRPPHTTVFDRLAQSCSAAAQRHPRRPLPTQPAFLLERPPPMHAHSARPWLQCVALAPRRSKRAVSCCIVRVQQCMPCSDAAAGNSSAHRQRERERANSLWCGAGGSRDTRCVCCAITRVMLEGQMGGGRMHTPAQPRLQRKRKCMKQAAT